MRTIPETIKYLRDMVANESVSLMLIETQEITNLLDHLETVEKERDMALNDDRGVL